MKKMIIESLIWVGIKRLFRYKNTKYRIVKVEYADGRIYYLLEKKTYRFWFWCRDYDEWSHLEALKNYIEEKIDEENYFIIKKESIVYQNE